MRIFAISNWIIIAIFSICTVLSVNSTHAQTVVVTNTNDSGVGSLRDAITYTNSFSGGGVINFNIPGPGPWVIAPTTNLPSITTPTTIDGTTQPGWSLSNSVKITKAGTSTIGLDINSGTCNIYGLEITGYNGSGNSGIHVAFAIFGVKIGVPGKGNVIGGNYYGLDLEGSDIYVKGNLIGTDNTGLVANGNNTGINLSGGNSVVIGGGAVGEGNIISGNTDWGIRSYNMSAGHFIIGNFIGLNKDGTAAIPNDTGILLGASGSESNFNTIGGASPNEGNIISGNLSTGLRLLNSSTNTIQGNKIGTDITGFVVIPNGTIGVELGFTSGNKSDGNSITSNLIAGSSMSFRILNGSSNTLHGNSFGVASDGSFLASPAGATAIVLNAFFSGTIVNTNVIGGTSAGQTNLIAGYSKGIIVDSGTGTADENSIRGNQIYCNTTMGIDLAGTANISITAPVISSYTVGVSTASVQGTCTGCVPGTFIDVYRDASGCSPIQGTEYLGTVSYTSDPWILSGLTLSAGDKVSAIQFDENGNTSEFGVIPLPTITSFTPVNGIAGSLVTITGTGFSTATDVSFGGVPATSFTVVSPTTITAVVASGTSGNVSVTTQGGTAVLSGFTFFLPPTIGSFTPLSSGSGATITITGTNFSGTTAVTIGGIAVSGFTVVSPTTIIATVGAGASGNVSVSTPGGTATLAGFTFIPAPTIGSFTPTGGLAGTLLTITGTNFTGATAVTIGGIAASGFTIVSSTTITATVGMGASGNVSVTTPGGTGTLAGFTFIPAPTISSFTPTSGPTGTLLTITGTDFTGASAVTIGGIPATVFTVVSSTTITATVGVGASGNVSVTTPGGTSSLAGFTLTSPEIDVYNGIDNTQPAILNGQSAIVNTGTTKPSVPLLKVFAIRNSGTSALNITSITVTGSGWTIVSLPSPSIGSLTTSTVTLQLASITTGTYPANVSILSDDSDESLFTFPISGQIIAALPVVYENNASSGTVITNGQTQAVDFGKAPRGNALQKTFSIQNGGNTSLQVLSVTADNTLFEVTQFPSSIAPGNSDAFIIVVKARDAGVYTSRVLITFADGTYEFTITAEVLPGDNPPIEVFNVVTPNGDQAHDFFKIRNIEFYSGNVVIIFNRWGDRVFEKKNYLNDDARNRFEGVANVGDTRTLDDGTYYYVIELGGKRNKETGYLWLQK